MKTINVKGEIRSDLGKGATRRLRSEGRVPAVLYGGENTIHCSIKPLDVRGLIYTPEFQIVELEMDGKTYRSIIKDIQFDVLTDELTHIDFLELVDNKKIIADLPISFVGAPVGVKEGGRLVIKLKSVRVRTLPRHLVEHLEVNIDDLELNGNVRVQDIPAENMEVMNPPRIPIASVVLTRALRQAGSEGEGDEGEGAPEGAEEAAAPEGAEAKS